MRLPCARTWSARSSTRLICLPWVVTTVITSITIMVGTATRVGSTDHVAYRRQLSGTRGEREVVSRPHVAEVRAEGAVATCGAGISLLSAAVREDGAPCPKVK